MDQLSLRHQNKSSATLPRVSLLSASLPRISLILCFSALLASTVSAKGDDKGTSLTVDIVNATSLSLRWTPPTLSDGALCPVQRYIIRLREEGVKKSRAWRLEPERHSVTLHDLHPSTGYQVRLMAMMCNRKRRSSKWTSFTTADLTNSQTDTGPSIAERQPPGPPVDVKTKTNVDSIVVTWQPPDDSALVRGYIIGYGEGVPDVNWRYVSLSQREVTIYGLKPSTQYVVSVRALNNFGKGQVVYDIITTKDPISTSNLIGGSLPSPVRLSSRILSPTTAYLEWTDPSLDSYQKISDERYYNVYYQALYPTTKNLSVIVKALHVTLYDLIPGRIYQFKVRTVKGSQTSPFSENIRNKTYSVNGEKGSNDDSLHRNENDGGIEDDEDDDEGDIRNVGETSGGQRRSAGQHSPGFHAEVKKKRAHNVVHESLARTLIMPQNNGSSVNSFGSTDKVTQVSFRAMVQYRVSAYVTWPEKPDSCSSVTAVAGYIFRYKNVEDVGEYVARNLAANFILLENLIPNTKYKYQVQYVMDRGGASGWSQEVMLDTNYYPSGA